MKYLKHIGIPILGFVIYYIISIFCVYLVRDPIFSTFLINILCSIGAYIYIKSINEKKMYTKQDWSYVSLEILVIIVLSFVFMWFTTQLTGAWYYEVFGDTTMDARTDSINSSKGSEYYFVLSFFLAPVWEELFLRSIMFRHLRELVGFWGSALISSVIFAAMHGTVIHMITAVVFGVFMCLLYQITNKISVSIFFHMAYNIITTLINTMTLDDMFFKTSVVISLNVINACVMFYLFYKYKTGLVEWKKVHRSERDYLL